MMTNYLTQRAFAGSARFLRALLALLVLIGSAPAIAEADEALTVKAVAQREPVHPGEQFAIAIVMEFGEGWHAWPNVPVVPEGLEGTDFGAIPTTIKLAQGKDGKPVVARGWQVHEAWTQWPTPHEVRSAGITQPVLSYSGRSAAYVPVTLDATTATGEVKLTFEVYYQACNESMCQQPTTETAEVTVKVVAVGDAQESKENQPGIFKGFDGRVFARIASGEPVPTSETPESTGTETPRPEIFGIFLPDPRSPIGILVLFIVSVIGGAIMNLTPCVLPVIPIKVMTLTQHAGGSHAKTLKLGIWMLLGVVAFWTAIGVPMAFISDNLEPSRYIFGIWWITLSLGLVIALMGVGIMGLFQVRLPQAVYSINPKADTSWGSFVFGVMTAILGLPCYAFIAGGLLAATSIMPSIAIIAIYVGIGLGMGAPYLVLAMKPELIEKIPRTGPASELVKQVMGLLLLAAAGFFVTAGLQTLFQWKHYFAVTMQWWVVALFVFLAGAWLTIRTLQITKKSWPRIVMPALSLLLVGGAVAYAVSETSTERENAKYRIWTLYTPESFEKAKSSGKVIICDFTANWCVLCKGMKSRFLDTDPVRSELIRGDVVPFKVDLSDHDAPGWKFLNELGRSGVPTLAVFSPGLDKPIIFNAYTSDTVMNALAKARIASVDQGSLGEDGRRLARDKP